MYLNMIIPVCIQVDTEKASEWRRGSTWNTVRSHAAQPTKVPT